MKIQTTKNKITIIGGGLAGCECAYQLAKRGFKIDLYEMKPQKYSPAHKSSTLGEVVCSNSFKSESLENASGLLKAELEQFDSLILKVAKNNRVPAGSALAVDRKKFSEEVDATIKSFKNINVISEEVVKIPEDGVVVIASGPLTSDALASDISKVLGEDSLYFFDASAPIIDGFSIDFSKTFIQDRYGEDGVGDYINCPLDKEEYYHFVDELINANSIKLHDFETKKVFEGCIPIEEIAKRGRDSLRFGPLRPTGLYDKTANKRPYAVVQLRKENVEALLYNIVGFQTNLTFGEQERVFSIIPALKNAEFIKLGVMHKNTYICSPKHLTKAFNLKLNNKIYFAGQISGVEGYMESVASGLICALDIIAKSEDILYNFSSNTILGALSNYISNPSNANNFQPMNANYGIISPIENKTRDKIENKKNIYKRSLKEIKEIKERFK